MNRTVRLIAGLFGLVGALYVGAYMALSAPPEEVSDDWQSKLGQSQTPQGIAGPSSYRPEPPEMTRIPMKGTESRRKVLALYNSAEEHEEEDDHGHRWMVPVNSENNRFHRLGELPLNHVGLVVDFQDVNDPKGMPGEAIMSGYRGVVSWLGIDRCRDPEGLLRWYAQQAQAGRVVVLIERTGARFDLKKRPVDPKVESEAMTALGIHYGAEEIWDPERITVEADSGKRTAFERPLDLRLPYWRDVRALDPEAKVWLQLGRRDVLDRKADAVIVGRNASYVMREYALREAKIGERWVRQWQIDPFEFYAQAFHLVGPAGSTGEPRLDFTTLNGSRIFYAHIDGDGMGTISEIDRRSKCGELVRDRLLAHYDLPCTVSAVVGRIQPPPEAYGSQRDVDVARSIFALPNVETASHGLAHPMDWRAGKDAELAVDDIPDYEMNAEFEIAKSTKYINEQLTLSGKPVRIMLWTGWCNPTAEQIGVADRLGIYNLNGGDPRMDRLYPSYAHMAPPIHRVGDTFQYFTSGANDFILTDDWQPPYYRFGNIVDTFENTASPVRVVPVNIYYHCYITQKSSALAGIKRAYDWVVRHDLAPMFASQYVAIVQDFYHGRVARLGPKAWRIRTQGHLRTVRFDGPRVEIDLRRSKGVMGYKWEAELSSTYVHLTGPEATVVTTDLPPKRAYLYQASHHVEGFTRKGRAIHLTITGVGQKKIWIGGVEPERAYAALFSAPHDPDRQVIAQADRGGRVAFEFKGNGTYAVRVTPR